MPFYKPRFQTEGLRRTAERSLVFFFALATTGCAISRGETAIQANDTSIEYPTGRFLHPEREFVPPISLLRRMRSVVKKGLESPVNFEREFGAQFHYDPEDSNAFTDKFHALGLKDWYFDATFYVIKSRRDIIDPLVPKGAVGVTLGGSRRAPFCIPQGDMKALFASENWVEHLDPEADRRGVAESYWVGSGLFSQTAISYTTARVPKVCVLRLTIDRIPYQDRIPD